MNKIVVRDSLVSDQLEVYMFEYDTANRKTLRATRVDFDQDVEPYSPSDNIVPTMWLSREMSQELADSLWSAGIRPNGAKGSAGQLGATERHLSDMRSLVKHHTGADL